MQEDGDLRANGLGNTTNAMTEWSAIRTKVGAGKVRTSGAPLARNL
jgi:hypothetical protein